MSLIPISRSTSMERSTRRSTFAFATNTSVSFAASIRVWRSLNGGANWTPIFDTAQSLSIGALALAPSNPSILYVGTGEPNNSADSFFGVGVYRIDNADTTADLVGPINPVITTGSGGGA